VLGVQAAPQADLVEALPGWDKPLLSKAYSGYIPVGMEDGLTMYEHYLFFESENDPATDPVIMWTNGGPGASSLFGSFTELGPYYLSGASVLTSAYNSTGVPTLFENKWRWTKLGSLIVRNLPPPVGFSYCDPVGPAGDGNSCGSWNDTKTAKHSYEFMKGFMKAFPEYSKNSLFITGESYAGLYVPMLVREIIENPSGEGAGLFAQLKGFAVGDGCLGGSNDISGVGSCTPNLGPYFEVEFFHGHGQFSDKTYAEIQTSCGKELVDGVKSDACKAALQKMDAEKGFSFDYNLYDECFDFSLGTKPWHEQRTWWGPPRMSSAAKGLSSGSSDWHMDGTPCGGGGALAKWVNNSKVKAALHVSPLAYFFTGDNGVGFTYNLTEPSLVPWYKEVTAKSNLRIMIYNGDTDPGLNSFYAQNWTVAVGLPESEPWRPWTRDGKIRMGGFVTRYKSAGAFDFITIRGSGHMVPEYKPEAAFVMLQSFVTGADFPKYSPQPEEGHLSFETTIV